jgi:LPXTG-site transpeptidase (sortase) family protein
MSLRISGLTKKIPHIILAVVGAFLLACLVRVIVWEHFYYKEMEGSLRHPIIEVGIGAPTEPEEVDETPVTEEQIRAHTVSPDKPRYLKASFMGQSTKARIREVGLTQSGAMATLPSIFDVAWYRYSSKPGEGGTIVMNGHNGGPTRIGIFKHLDQVQEGDIITVERGDGVIFKYQVYENQILSLVEASRYMATMLKSPIEGIESLSLISCTGEWSQTQRTFLSRTMVRAFLVENPEN